MRDGRPPWFKTHPAQYVKLQREDRSTNSKIQEKLRNVLTKGNIAPGHVEGLTHYFAIPKGVSDVRMVCDASASGLNSSLWVPTFALPTANALLDLLTPMSWMSDLDMGEQFLNFALHPDIQ
jgi:hypothetical protein